jgi:hypothetical protein
MKLPPFLILPNLTWISSLILIVTSKLLNHCPATVPVYTLSLHPCKCCLTGNDVIANFLYNSHNYLQASGFYIQVDNAADHFISLIYSFIHTKSILERLYLVYLLLLYFSTQSSTDFKWKFYPNSYSSFLLLLNPSTLDSCSVKM